ncbi:MAG: tetratricopeptide repeat protein, partial [Candidatus Omnitrophica bacterium]|nr:tetratricopeptide repeat protein [Candidatus Omnitrophota bacterium]
MKRAILLISAALVIFSGTASAVEEKKSDPNQLFYTANHSYESRDYVKAMEGYVAILESGLESGNLYYNIGNGYLKMGRLGQAILCYERAKRLIPHDSDLRANLTYARSLAENTNDRKTGNFIL